MKLKIIATVEDVTMAHNGPIDADLEGLIYTRAAAHAMLDTALNAISFPEDA